MDSAVFTLSSNGANDLIANNVTSDNVSVITSLIVSGNTTLQNSTTINNSLNVSGNTIMSNSLNVSGTTFLNNTSINGIFNVSGISVLNNNTIIYGTLDVSGSTLLSNSTLLGSFNVSGNATINNLSVTSVLDLNNMTLRGNLYVSNTSTLNNVSVNSSLVVTGLTQFNNSVYCLDLLNVVGTKGLIVSNANVTCNSSLNISGNDILSFINNTNQNFTNFSYLTAQAYANTVGTTLSNAGYTSVSALLSPLVNALNLGNYVFGLVMIANIAIVAVETNINTGNINNLTTNLNSLSSQSFFYTNYTNMNFLNVSQTSILNGATTCKSSLNVSGITTLNNTSINGTLTISGNSTLLSSVNISGITTLNNTSINGVLNVSGNSTFNNQTTLLSSVNISGLTVLSNNTSINGILNVSGNAIFNNQITCLSSLNVAGNLTVAGTTTEVNMIIQSNETVVSSLNVSGTSTFNNQLTCLSSLNVSGTSNMGPLYINNLIGTQNTFLNIGLNSSGDAYYRVNYNTAGSRMHMFGDSTGNNYMSMTPNSVTIQGSTTINSTLNCVGNIYAPNIPSQAAFNVIISTPCIIGSTTYYRYDLDLTKYTTYITIAPTTQTRKFKFMSWLTSGAHNSGLYSLNYDIDYSFINYTGLGTLAAYNGLNALAYGYPYQNYNLNQITPNGLFIWKYTFNYITIFASVQNTNLQCLIIDYLN